MQSLIVAAISAPADVTASVTALEIARHFRDEKGLEVSATRLALTCGLTPAAAKAEGFHFVKGISEDIAEDSEREMTRAIEWAQQYVLLPTGNVDIADFLIGDSSDFSGNRALAAERGKPFILIDRSPSGYTAHIQTAEGLCEPRSPRGEQHDPSGRLQNACDNLNTLIARELPRLLASDGVTPEEWQEWQEDVRVAHDARHGPGIDMKTGKFSWLTSAAVVYLRQNNQL